MDCSSVLKRYAVSLHNMPAISSIVETLDTEILHNLFLLTFWQIMHLSKSVKLLFLSAGLGNIEKWDAISGSQT